MKPPRKGRLGWVLAGVTSLLFGCVAPADLANPDDISPLVGADVPLCVTKAMRAAKCNIDGCHGSINPAAGLNLTRGLSQLKDKPATHTGITQKAGAPPIMCPTGDKLIDSANPANSWMLKKLNMEDGECGEPMPVGFGITAGDKQCLVDWIMSFGSGSGGMGAGGGASGGAGGSSGGSGGGAGAAAGGSAGTAAGTGGGGAGGTGGLGGGGTGGTG